MYTDDEPMDELKPYIGKTIKYIGMGYVQHDGCQINGLKIIFTDGSFVFAYDGEQYAMGIITNKDIVGVSTEC